MGAATGPRAATLLLLFVTAVIAAVPAFLHGTRALLDVDLPDPAPVVVSGQSEREARLRGRRRGSRCTCSAAQWSAWGLLVALPMMLILIAQQFGVALDGLRIGGLDERDSGWLTLILLVYAVAGLGGLAA